jgi:molecular chaperone DnaK
VAENAAYQAEKQLTEMGDQIDAAAKEEITSAIAEVRGVLTSENAEEIKTKTDALQAAFHKVSEQIYQAAAAQQGAQQPGDGASTDGGAGESDEEVVDAEVVDDERA